MTQPSRAISKEGPPALRLAFFQAANAARRVDPQLAALYQRLMVERGHCHTSATVAVARKLAERTWTVLSRGKPYQLRDLDGQPITERGARRGPQAGPGAQRRHPSEQADPLTATPGWLSLGG